MARSHRSAISFSMVHIPAELSSATQDDDIHFNQLCKENSGRIKYMKICARRGKEAGSSDMFSPPPVRKHGTSLKCRQSLIGI